MSYITVISCAITSAQTAITFRN